MVLFFNQLIMISKLAFDFEVVSCRTKGLSPSKGNIAVRNKMLYECYPGRAKANDPFTDSFQVVYEE